MELVLLVIQIIVAIIMIGVILLQKTSSDGLSGFSGGSGNNSLITGRSAASFLTKLTGTLAAIFMINSLILGNLAYRNSKDASLVEKILQKEEAQTPAAPAEAEEPQIPVAK